MRSRSGSNVENEADRKTREEYRVLGRDFVEFDAEQLDSFITKFMSVDRERKGYLRPETLVDLLAGVGENVERENSTPLFTRSTWTTAARSSLMSFCCC